MSISLTLKNVFSFAAPSSDELMADYALSGDSKILARLYDAMAKDVYHFLCSQTDPDSAKDLAQRTWVRVIDKRHLYRQEGNVKAWLFRIARNLLIDDIRANKRFVDDDSAELSEPFVLDTQLDADRAFDLAMDALPWLQREAFILQQEGFSLTEIADICAEPAETIKSRLRYARNKLKTVLEAYNV